MQNNCGSYKDAIDALNNLQTNLTNKEHNHQNVQKEKIEKTKKYLLRSGVTLEDLDQLSVIHITGTKGKGTTAAYCESILRHHGFSTGFFCSPHLVEVRERINLKGSPINHEKFSSYFWDLYNCLEIKKEHDEDIPTYFMFLVILAFHIFLKEKVDVAIIEVGIGGEYDCTNILRNVLAVGITSIGIDHTPILGSTLEKIAWHKSGIMKPNCKAFSAPQEERVINILIEKSIERKCSLKILDDEFIELVKPYLNSSVRTLPINAALALKLTECWYNKNGITNKNQQYFITSNETVLGLKNCFWPGRYHHFTKENFSFYADGAHTIESIKLCIEWFIDATVNSDCKKVLIFNSTGARNKEEFLRLLNKGNFDMAFFVPNIARKNNYTDNFSVNNPANSQLQKCEENKRIWLKLLKSHENVNAASVFPSVFDALNSLGKDLKYTILVTGSLHLVGALLDVMHPDSKNCDY